MFHRYSAVANCLKNATQFEALLPQGLKAAKNGGNGPKYVYTPMEVQTRAASAPASGKVLYKRWQDIPDSMIPTTSKRDPYNTIYRHPKYIAFRKKQIFYQQDDGIPIYLKGGVQDYILTYGSFVLAFITVSMCIYEWARMELRWFQRK